MNAKVLSLVAGASMLGFVAAASAADRVSLTNTDMDGLRAGMVPPGWVVSVYKNIYDRVDLGGRIYFDVSGRTAQANADAAFEGARGFAFTGTDAFAGKDFGYSQSFSTAHSGDLPYHPPCCNNVKYR